ncbi:hypothetical protein ABW19_dt0204327 [Dactylella cylindrospora]|nr:hypothetical protein ABW19_dt0204327 [Dactylella cylindrospora]
MPHNSALSRLVVYLLATYLATQSAGTSPGTDPYDNDGVTPNYDYICGRPYYKIVWACIINLESAASGEFEDNLRDLMDTVMLKDEEENYFYSMRTARDEPSIYVFPAYVRDYKSLREAEAAKDAIAGCRIFKVLEDDDPNDSRTDTGGSGENKGTEEDASQSSPYYGLLVRAIDGENGTFSRYNLNDSKSGIKASAGYMSASVLAQGECENGATTSRACLVGPQIAPPE